MISEYILAVDGVVLIAGALAVSTPKLNSICNVYTVVVIVNA